MALRKTLLATGETYHIFNRSVSDIPIFKSKKELKVFTECMHFYLQVESPVKYSVYRKGRNRYPIDLNLKLVTIINYCLMPNHFHFTLRQEQDYGIKKFIQRLTNSFAHYYSTKTNISGHVFQGNFKAVHVETDEQLLHLSRYIHLNPVTAYIVEQPEDYPYSSYNVYIGDQKVEFVDPSLVLKQFSSSEKYRNFVNDQKDYQRTLNAIKHMVSE